MQAEVVKRYKDSQIYSVNVCRMMMFRISIQDGIKLLLSASEIPTEMVLEGLCKSKLEDSVQLQTVLAM